MWIGDRPLSSSLAVPFFKDLLIPFGMFFIVVGMLVVVGAGNAVNITDGLDGLAIVPVMIAAASLGLIAYLVGNFNFSNYLELHFVRGSGELAIICGAIVGAGLGFLWFNAPPAMIFMGDTGSLSLGGALGAIAVAAKHEIVLAIIGGLFVLETASVIIQVASFKTDRQARLRHGAAASSLRAEGLEGTHHRHPLLDHRHRAGADRPVDAEAQVEACSRPGTFKGQEARGLRTRALGHGLHRGAAAWRRRGSRLG